MVDNFGKKGEAPLGQVLLKPIEWRRRNSLKEESMQKQDGGNRELGDPKP